MGFHSVPSMKQIHMHIISQDFDSPNLKNKKHYLSFTTEYFVEADDFILRLENLGKIEFDRQQYEELLKGNLLCHLCKKNCNTIPALKLHLASH